MKVGTVGVVHTSPPASTIPLRQVRVMVRCFSSSGHVSFIEDVVATQPPKHLHYLFKMLQARGETIISPGYRQGSVTALLRWLTAPAGRELLVVEVHNHGVWFLAKNVDQYIHRILVEEDANKIHESNVALSRASSELGKKLYNRGIFPDVLESKVMRYFEQGDRVTAMVTGEFYTKKDPFPGFAQPFVFYARILQKVRYTSEAKDAARVALKSPWWTLGCAYREVARIPQWEDEQIEYIKEKVIEEGRQEDQEKGKAPVQIAMDEAAFLLDLASVEGTWDDVLKRIAQCYREPGFDDFARFVL